MLNIAIASDLNYLPHAGTLIRSLYDNNRNVELNIHLLTMDYRVVTDEPLEDFFRSIMSSRVNIQIHFIGDDNPFIKQIPDGGVILSRATYLRFLAAELIPADRILYLDCDMIVLDNLQSLFEMNLEDRILAAVPDLFVGPSSIKHSFSLRYFNSGMLLINAEKWRKEKWLDKAIQFIENKFTTMCVGKKHYGDQDIMNMLTIGKVTYVHPRYNVVNPVYLRRNFFYGKIFDEAINNPAIVHFAGGAKPWNNWEIHPLSDRYFFYRLQTPWKTIELQKPTLKIVARYLSMWCKYNFSFVIYMFSELIRKLRGKGTRVILSEQIENLIIETTDKNL
ncbi:MAG: glycosyltransferase family 8 protein [Planctomycetaceae bacterium]|jgi:lipopolysaccharide biosynthesis glycosyltransferase|nr:glycosyltransferase family 8 protein [Planctomycetaceae bacterium]